MDSVSERCLCSVLFIYLVIPRGKVGVRLGGLVSLRILFCSLEESQAQCWNFCCFLVRLVGEALALVLVKLVGF